MDKARLYELLMTALGAYQENVRTNRNILNSVRTRELTEITEAMRILSASYPKNHAKRRSARNPRKDARKGVSKLPRRIARKGKTARA